MTKMLQNLKEKKRKLTLNNVDQLYINERPPWQSKREREREKIAIVLQYTKKASRAQREKKSIFMMLDAC